LKIKLNKQLEFEIHEHIIAILVFSVFILIIAVNDAYLGSHNCHALEPTVTCADKGQIPRSTFVNNPDYVFIPAKVTIGTTQIWYSVYHMDEYRQKAPDGLGHGGFLHAECTIGNQTCSYHFDTFNAVPNNSPLVIFSLVGHLADTLSTSCYSNTLIGNGSCFGTPDYLVVVGIWGVFYFGSYFTGWFIYMKLKKKP
jgi:hypothetical protein